MGQSWCWAMEVDLEIYNGYVRKVAKVKQEHSSFSRCNQRRHLICRFAIHVGVLSKFAVEDEDNKHRISISINLSRFLSREEERIMSL